MTATIPIDDLDDPRLLPYRQLKDRHLAEQHGLLIAEGEYLVHRLLTAPRIRPHSLLVARQRAAKIIPVVPAGVPIYVMPEPRLSDILGFPFHRGMLACGFRPDMHRLDDILPAHTLAVCPHLQNIENLGLIIRTAEALGAQAMLVGDRGADPYMRRCIRVSMGSALTLPIVQSRSIASDLKRLRDGEGFDLVATVLSDDAMPLDAYHRADRVAVLLGSEPDGLNRQLADLCTHHVTIPMAPDAAADSLNVAVAAGIVLNHVRRLAADERR